MHGVEYAHVILQNVCCKENVCVCVCVWGGGGGGGGGVSGALFTLSQLLIASQLKLGKDIDPIFARTSCGGPSQVPPN